MESECVRDMQIFFKAVCEVARDCEADESRYTTITCVEWASPSSETIKKRSRSTTPKRDRSPANSDSTLLASLKGLASTHIDTAHPYLHPTKAPPSGLLRNIYDLLVYGEGLFMKHQRELLRFWDVLAQSRECDVPWDAALLAALAHSFTCVLRELHDILDTYLPGLLRRKREFWEVLAHVNLVRLRDTFMNKHQAMRNLIL